MIRESLGLFTYCFEGCFIVEGIPKVRSFRRTPVLNDGDLSSPQWDHDIKSTNACFSHVSYEGNVRCWFAGKGRGLKTWLNDWDFFLLTMIGLLLGLKYLQWTLTLIGAFPFPFLLVVAWLKWSEWASSKFSKGFCHCLLIFSVLDIPF